MGIRAIGEALGDLDDLDDVNAPAPSNNDSLTWDTATGKWVPEAVSGGSSPLTTKGDIFGFSTVDARLPIGTNTHVLTADSAQSLGVKWAAAAAAGSYWTDVVLSSDFTTDQTSPQTSPLAFTPAASHAYIVRVLGLITTANNSTGPRMGVQWPTAGLASGSTMLVTPNSATAVVTRTYTAGTDGNSLVSTGVGTGDWGIHTLDAVFVTNGSIAGDFAITMQSETLSTTVTLGIGSTLQYREIV